MARRRSKRGWGAGEVLPTANGFRIRWREGGERRSRSGFATRDDATKVLAKIMGDLALGRAGLPPDGRGVERLAALADKVIERRALTHRSADMDRIRWRKHLAPHFGHLKPVDVDVARIRAFVELKLAERLNPATIRILITLLSAVFVDLVERQIVTVNPARGLPDSLMRLMRSTHDPKKTPFLEKLDDVRRVYLALPEPLNVAFAIGAFGGLRTGEVFALRWEHVDLATRRIHVRESVKGPLKDGDSRIVPVLDPLIPVLKMWKLATGGEGRVIPAMRIDGEKISKETPGNYLRPALRKLGLTVLADHPKAWYCATRHTFASQWVLAGNSIEKLATILGHYSVVMTEKYAHLRPELFAASDLSTLQVDLGAHDAEPVQMAQKRPKGRHDAASASEGKVVGAAL